MEAGLGNLSDTLNMRIDDLELAVGDVSSRFADIEARIDALASDLQNQIDSLRSRQDTTDARIDIIERRLDEIDLDFSGLEALIAEVRNRITNIETCSAQLAFYAPDSTEQTIQGCVELVESVALYPDDVLLSRFADTRGGNTPNVVEFALSDVSGRPTHLYIDSLCSALGAQAISRVQLFQIASDGSETDYDLCLVAGVLNGESTQNRISHFIPLTDTVERFRIVARYTQSVSTAFNNTRAFARITLRGDAED